MMKKLGKRIKVVRAVPLQEYKMLITFEDGSEKEIDLKRFMHGPIFEPILNNRQLFENVQLTGGTIGWENGADIDPDVLFYDIEPAWMEEKQSI